MLGEVTDLRAKRFTSIPFIVVDGSRLGGGTRKVPLFPQVDARHQQGPSFNGSGI
ncbi:hypothetical protein [Streptomyces sp. NPDC029674]|uniref:hypothetical protein n=1 Tax=Streptomyces sp. NPDC029674 TaxID=3365297 RepID=UPI0038514716